MGKILTQASLDEEYAQNVPSRWRRATQRLSWLGFLWLVPPTLPQNWVSFTAGYGEETCQSSPMAVQRSYVTFQGFDNLRGISGSDLRLLGGVSLGSMASLWLKMSWRGSMRKFCRLPELFGTENTRSVRTWFRTLPKTLTVNFLCSPRFRPQPIYSSLAGVTSWLNVCGSSLSWRPAELMSVLPGRAKKFWLVPYVVRNICVGSLSQVCSFICFSQSFWMECFQDFWVGLSSGWRHTSSSGLSLRNVVPALGCLWGRGGGTVSTVWLWGWLIAIMAMLAANWSSLGKFCAQLTVGRLWSQFVGGHTPLWNAIKGIWGAGAFADCWINHLLTSGCSNAAYKKLLPLCSGRSIFRWLNSSWPDSKALSIVIGCSQDDLWDVQLRQAIFLRLGWWILLARSSGFGRLMSLTSKILAKNTEAIVLWYDFPLLVSVLAWLPLFISVFMFRKKGYMDTSTLTSWEEWISACSISFLNCVGIRISVHNCVVFPNRTCILCMEILGVNVLHSWRYPHCQMVRDF